MTKNFKASYKLTFISMLMISALLGMYCVAFAYSPITVKYKGEFNESKLKKETQLMAYYKGKGFNDLYKEGKATIKMNNPNINIYTTEWYMYDTVPKYSQKLGEGQTIGIKNKDLKRMLGSKDSITIKNAYELNVKDAFCDTDLRKINLHVTSDVTIHRMTEWWENLRHERGYTKQSSRDEIVHGLFALGSYYINMGGSGTFTEQTLTYKFTYEDGTPFTGKVTCYFTDIDQNLETVTIDKNYIKNSTIYVPERKMMSLESIDKNSRFWWLREVVDGDKVKYESKSTNPWDSSPHIDDNENGFRTGFYFQPDLNRYGHRGELTFRSTANEAGANFGFTTIEGGAIQINKTIK